MMDVRPARSKWIWRIALMFVVVAAFVGGCLCGHFEKRLDKFRRDIVFANFIKVVSLVPAEVIEQKHPGTCGAFISKQVDMALQEPLLYFAESELTRDELNMVESAWKMAIKYTGRERIKQEGVGVKAIPRRREPGTRIEGIGSTNTIHESGQDAH